MTRDESEQLKALHLQWKNAYASGDSDAMVRLSKKITEVWDTKVLRCAVCGHRAKVGYCTC